MAGVEQEILALNQKLLNAIAESDWKTYAELCDGSLTAFEPEALGHLVAGLEFHEFYFKLSSGSGKVQNTMSDAHVRVIGSVALLCYYRLTQFVDPEGRAQTRGTEETRVWQQVNGKWKHIHFHRSPSQRT